MRTMARVFGLLSLAVAFPAPAPGQDDPYAAERLVERKQQYPANESNTAAGKQVYNKRCAFCHGDEGRGDGGAAPYLDPRPRDFTKGLFKFRSTFTGELPTDEDLFRTVSRGVPGTAMPAWGEPPFTLSEKERWQVIYYVKELSTEDFADPDFNPYDYMIALPPVPPYTQARVDSGYVLYSDEKKGACVKCHGNSGRGDGAQAGTQKDDWGDEILPGDLSKPWNYKNGSSLAEMFRTFSTGINGSPMPGYAESLSEEQRWNLVCYVKSLHVERSEEGKIVLLAKKWEGELPLDATDPFWQQQAPMDIPMAGQMMVTPRHTSSTINLITVRAAYNDQAVAFHFSWTDRIKNEVFWGDTTMVDTATADGSAPVGKTEEHWVPELKEPGSFVLAKEIWARRKIGFRDRLQIQFPVKISDGPNKPFFFMGNAGEKVNLWTWQADGNEDSTSQGGTVAQERNASGYRKAPVTQKEESQALEGRALFENGLWQLVVKRPLTTPDNKLDVQFQPGMRVPFALQAWDGANGEEGLLCAVSSWYYVMLQGQTDKAGYAWAILGILFTLGGETLAVRKARKSGKLRSRR